MYVYIFTETLSITTYDQKLQWLYQDYSRWPMWNNVEHRLSSARSSILRLEENKKQTEMLGSNAGTLPIYVNTRRQDSAGNSDLWVECPHY